MSKVYGPYSDSDALTYGVDAEPDLAKPTNFHMVQTAPNVGVGTWDAVVGAEGYEVEVSQSSDFAGASSIEVADETFTDEYNAFSPDTGPVTGQTYYYRVRAFRNN